MFYLQFLNTLVINTIFDYMYLSTHQQFLKLVFDGSKIHQILPDHIILYFNTLIGSSSLYIWYQTNFNLGVMTFSLNSLFGYNMPNRK